MLKTNIRRSAKLLVGLLILTASTVLHAGEINKTFEDVSEVRIKTVSGDCLVEKGQGEQVKVLLTFTYDDRDYQPNLEKRGQRLYLTEEFFGRDHSGRATWKLSVPGDVEIDFSTSSGDLAVSGLNKTEIEAKTASGDLAFENMGGNINAGTASGDITLSGVKGNLTIATASGDVQINASEGDIEVGTASGQVRLEKIDGDMEIGTASGSIRISGATGGFEVGTASGRVTAKDVTITGKSKFEAASGDVELSLQKSPGDDLKVSAASGDVLLNYGGNAITGFIEMTAEARLGRIRAPFEFDEEHRLTRGGREFVTKTAKRGDGPDIEISTTSGRAELRE